MRQILSFLLAVAASLTIVACSTSGWTKMGQPLSQQIPPGKSVSLSVGIDTPEHQTDVDFQLVTTRVRQQLFAKLMSEGIFSSVLLGPQPADYDMTVTVNSASVVSGTARYWEDLLAGHNDARMHVKLVRNDGNLVIADFEVDGTSTSQPISSEAGTDEAVREATDRIIRGLR